MCAVKNGSAAWLMVVAVCASTTSAAVLTVGPGQMYSTVQATVNASSNGDTIEIYSDTYTGSQGNASISRNNLTLRGVGATRPILDAGGTSTAGKAIWVISGSNTTVEFIEFRNCDVPDNNGAGIRQQGTNLTVTDCYFHDNEEGILAGADTSSTIMVEYSEFYNNGYLTGQSHNMYIGNIGTFILRHCWSHYAYVGHEVKTRARVNYIEYNRISNEAGNASYEINIPNGGTSYIIGNMIQQGLNTGNSGIISYAEEGASNPDQHLYVINNTIVNNRHTCTFVRNASTTDCLLQNNIFQGNGTVLNGPGTLVTNWITGFAYLADPFNYDYHLTANSTGAIDTGSDPGFGLGYSLTPIYEYLHPTDYQSRPTDATLDIGAYEYVPAGPPTVQFDLTSSSGDESVTPVNLAVSLSASSDDTVTVNYAVTGGTATREPAVGDLDGDQDVDLDDYTMFESAMNGPDQAGGNLDADFDTDGDVDLADFGTFAEALASGGGADYALVDGTLTFDPSVITQYVSITIFDDGEEEPDETIEVTLSNASNASLGSGTVHTYTINDNDTVITALLEGPFDPGAEGFVAGRRHFQQHQPAGLRRRQPPAQWRDHHTGHQLPIDFGRQLQERRARRAGLQD